MLRGSYLDFEVVPSTELVCEQLSEFIAVEVMVCSLPAHIGPQWSLVYCMVRVLDPLH